MRYTYPAVFEQDGNGFFVHFPDIDGASTCGNSFKEAIEMAVDALSLMLCHYEETQKTIPVATAVEALSLNCEQLVRLITVDTDEYAELTAKIEENPIKYAREYAGFSIKELAEYLDAPYRTVQDWNAGKSRPPRWIEHILYNHIISAKYSDRAH